MLMSLAFFLLSFFHHLFVNKSQNCYHGVCNRELSNLRKNEVNRTSAFSEVQEIKCVQGRYPDRLVELWELYDEDRGSENDSPDIFGKDQLFIILEFANGGRDMEAFTFNNAQQSFALFKQVSAIY